MVLNHKEKVDSVFDGSEYLAHLLTRYAIIEARFIPTSQRPSTEVEHTVHQIYTAPSEALRELKSFVVDMYVAILEYSAEVKGFQEVGKLGTQPVLSSEACSHFIQGA